MKINPKLNRGSDRETAAFWEVSAGKIRQI